MSTPTAAPPTPTLVIDLPEDRVEIDLHTLQGLWSDEQYVRLTNGTNRLIELTDGVLEVLPWPTDRHQRILRFLLFTLTAFLHPRGGDVMFAALRVQIRPGKYREPDLLAFLDAADPRIGDAFWRGADLVMEIVSPDNPERDLVVKRTDYAEGGIPEYWIVNPLDTTITVLRLTAAGYTEHGIFGRGTTATSALLPDFAVAVDAVLDAK